MEYPATATPVASRNSAFSRRAISALAILVFGIAGGARLAAAHGDGTFPRTFNLDWRNNINATYDSRYDVLVVSERVLSTQLDSLRTFNPSIRRLIHGAWYVYYNAGPSGYPADWPPFDAADPRFGFERKFWDLLNQNNWWLWARDSAGVRYHASMTFNCWDGNFTTKCPKVNGKRLCDVWGDFLVDNLLTQRHGDGLFFDYMMDGIGWMNWWQWGHCPYGVSCNDAVTPSTPDTKFKSAYDCDNNGIPDPPESTDVWWKGGMNIIMDRLRARLGPNFYLVGNGQHHFAQMNGAMIEKFPFILGSYDPSPNPYHYKWNSNMFSTAFGYLNTYESIFTQPRFNMIDVTTAAVSTFEPDRSPDRERFKRYTLASTLMGDGYHGVRGPSNAYTWWEPEWDLQLGWPMGVAISVVTTQGVTIYRRNFTNGDAWVNPTGTAVTATPNYPAVAAWDGVIRQLSGVGVDDVPAAARAKFEAVYPNPVRGDGSLQFTLENGAEATLHIYDIRGRLVKDVWTGVGTGSRQVAVWDGSTDFGTSAPAGIYFATLYSNGRKLQQRFVRMP